MFNILNFAIFVPIVGVGEEKHSYKLHTFKFEDIAFQKIPSGQIDPHPVRLGMKILED